MKKFNKLGYMNISLISPKIKIGNPIANMKEIINWIKKEQSTSQVIAFPELSLTGYTCEDIFLKKELYEEIDKAFLLLDEIRDYKNIIIIGLPYQYNDKLYNCAAVIYKGKIRNIIPKTHIPEYNEFYEKRWFTSGKNIKNKKVNNNIIFGTNQIIQTKKMKLAIEICEDMWSSKPPSIQHSQNGANVIVNLSASPEVIHKKHIRKKIIDALSETNLNAYCYLSSGIDESTKDLVFGGHQFAYENGTLIGENFSFNKKQKLRISVDLDRINQARMRNQTFADFKEKKYTISKYKTESTQEIFREYKKYPFCPQDHNDQRVEDIIQIQSIGLKRRLDSIGKNTKIIVGLSGGLDSTLALLVALETVKPTNIYAYSMPAFGTSDRTRNNAKELARLTGVNFQEIDITEECQIHLKNLNHNEIDVTFENTQARIRTLHLFNLANKNNGIVLGTGDLSEIALGWSTYNGDHMSNYNVNASVPKTLIKYLVQYFYKKKELKDILTSIVETKISPELLPNESKADENMQSTEDIIGKYDIHDFILYHFIKNGHSRKKIHFLIRKTFPEVDADYYIFEFFKRFQMNQFKRTTMPPGPKIGTVSLSPRGDWRMPDELKLF